ncbi:type I restriction enzyme HsdR N-terminal domain-containing protein [Burkholderia sola]|uniref:type I restriction enzyme HsdR N-terminal domain-containing protein n=1 Tax=Burkholderia sola TaxID=2843302 RepID=UPI001C0A87F9|nr:hypothetical protein BCCR75386_03291 [Burkholderia cenocepacia]CAG2304798.1 hypothetical protein BCCR75387_03290 [Burkholderia cenocepacia]CAG2304811.1 hypothetical protein BCCR75384_03290 [Burkholderia cenocepacia]CAG2304819.1 hypothetical protein BCCR75388_03293 [Burkholderia cenocepacia]CAG2304828.1 hypothetical protein BCCR12632_03293 [Burkholderia cenocepacia]
MSFKKLTKTENEATLEAKLRPILQRLFPWNIKLEHQTKFSFQIGHRKFEIDGKEVSRIEGRTDILVSTEDGEPIAVVELKKEGLTLTKADAEQGLSYARLFPARPPLVIVTNGSGNTQVYDSMTGELLPGDTVEERKFKELIAVAGKVAADNLKRAIQTLLGPASSVWATAIEQATAEALEDATGGWQDWEQPFVESFIVPRTATKQIHNHLSMGARLILLQGAPLSGRSNVLRELVGQVDTDERVCLFVASEGGGGIFQRIADVLTTYLEWPITASEARDWLRNLSHASQGHRLVLLVDDLSRDTQVTREIVEIVGAGFGKHISVVATMTTSVGMHLRFSENGVSKSRIGKLAKLVDLLPLSDEEFEDAERHLSEHSVGLMNGARFAQEYRMPWFLRTMVGQVPPTARAVDGGTYVELPSMASLDLIRHTRDRFDDHVQLRSAVNSLAKAILEDAHVALDAPAALSDTATSFVIPRNTAIAHLGESGVNDLMVRSVIKEQIVSNAPALTVLLPELVASELAASIGAELLTRCSVDLEDAVGWFSGLAVLLPLGDVICAQALIDARVASPDSVEIHRLFSALFNRMRATEPSVSPELSTDDTVCVVNAVEPLILSHIAGMHTEVDTDGGPVDAMPAILFELSKVPVPLRRGDKTNMIMTHHFDDTVVVCPNYGVIEPITLTLFRCLLAHTDWRGTWVERVASENNIAQLYRTRTALMHMRPLASAENSRWAEEALNELIIPALGEYYDGH